MSRAEAIGFCGTYVLNGGIEAFLPILQPSSQADGQLKVARSPRWRAPSTHLEPLDASQVALYGTVFPDGRAFPIADHQYVLLVDPHYRDVAQEFLEFDLDQWVELDDGYLVRSAELDVLYSLSRSTDSTALRTFWQILARTTDDYVFQVQHFQEADRLLTFLAASPTLDRMDYYAAAVELAERGADEGPEKHRRSRRTIQVASRELGATFTRERLSRLGDARRREFTLRRRSDKQAPVEIQLSELVASPMRSEGDLAEFAEGVSQRFLDAARNGDPVAINLASAGDVQERHLRLDIERLLVLSNLVNGHFSRHGDVRILPPSSLGVAHQVARGGLMYRFARLAPDDSIADLWGNPWMPGSERSRRTDATSRLYASRRDLVPPTHRNLLTLADPHHRAWTDEFVMDVLRTVERWISNRLYRLGSGRHRGHMDRIVSVGAGIVVQLMSNVRRHARLSRSRLAVDTVGDSSLVQLYTTRGGGRRSANRLYISVSDTGVGIPASVRSVHESAAEAPAASIVDRVLEGQFRSTDEASGLGLLEIYDLVRGFEDRGPRAESVSPRFVLLTGDSRHLGLGVCHRRFVDATGNAHEQTNEWKSPVVGTTALVALPLDWTDTGESLDPQLAFDLGLD